MDIPLPVTVIGGYLGSGKTTLVNHLLRHANGRRLAVLVNEFGELPIDEDLIEATGDDLISLAGGCVCCSFGGDLVAAFARLRNRKPAPDHVLLEASGVALPHAIAATLSLVRGLQRESVVVLADAETLADRARDRYVGDTVTRQLESADLVLLNRCDLADDAALDEAHRTIARVATRALVVEVERASVPPGALLGAVPNPRHVRSPGNSDGKDAHKIVVHPRFASVVLRADEPLDLDALIKRLTEQSAGVVRAKGFLRDASGAMQTVQVVGRRATLEAAQENVDTGLVVIGLRPAFDPLLFGKFFPGSLADV